eukprot:365226-Chlamydomonas_euryale.AAC.9
MKGRKRALPSGRTYDLGSNTRGADFKTSRPSTTRGREVRAAIRTRAHGLGSNAEEKMLDCSGCKPTA